MQYNTIQCNTIKSLTILRSKGNYLNTTTKKKKFYYQTQTTQPQEKDFREHKSTIYYLPSTIKIKISDLQDFLLSRNFQKSIKCQTNHLNRTKEQKKKNKRKPCLSIEPPRQSRQSRQADQVDRQTRQAFSIYSRHCKI